MKIIAYRSDSGPRFGRVDDEVVKDLGASLSDLRDGPEIGALGDLDLLPPTPEPSKVVCVGLNYRDHAEESGQPIPSEPLLFAKFPSSLSKNGDPIVIPEGTDQVDYEGELGVVIGRRAKAAAPEKALDYVLGYTCVNDVSARDFQFADGQWVRGKSLDTFCPVGPWIVTGEEIADPQELTLVCRVNGEALQDSSTASMIFGVAELVSYISRWITLEPGDLIATGTPSGVGFVRTPQRFLQDSDVVEVEIESIGKLSNPVTSQVGA